jgi:hypothetical protein
VGDCHVHLDIRRELVITAVDVGNRRSIDG